MVFSKRLTLSLMGFLKIHAADPSVCFHTMCSLISIVMVVMPRYYSFKLECSSGSFIIKVNVGGKELRACLISWEGECTPLN